jgi:hypothetical protein
VLVAIPEDSYIEMYDPDENCALGIVAPERIMMESAVILHCLCLRISQLGVLRKRAHPQPYHLVNPVCWPSQTIVAPQAIRPAIKDGRKRQ